MDETRKSRPAGEPAQAGVPARKRRQAAGDRRRRTSRGDVPPVLTARGIEDFSVDEAVAAATESKAYAVRTSSSASRTATRARCSTRSMRFSPAPRRTTSSALRNLLEQREDAARKVKYDQADDELADDWREGGYPYKHLMSRKSYERRSTSCRSNC